jgi:hypothetical protein
MNYLKPYYSIKGYLERFTIFAVGRLHVRIHKILQADGTPYFHNHPFNYISIILAGNYTECILNAQGCLEYKYHAVGSVIFRSSKVHHYISDAENCRTLFIAWRVDKPWSLKDSPLITVEGFKRPRENGIYFRYINGKFLYCKFMEYWYIGHYNYDDADKEHRLSIYQNTKWKEIK